MAVRESGESVVFLHRVERGAADRSYGIHVARLAGIPRAVVDRANEILGNIERDEFGRDGLPRRARRRGRGSRPLQPSLFGEAEPSARSGREASDGAAEVVDELRAQETDRLTPIEALNLISAWRRKLRPEEES